MEAEDVTTADLAGTERNDGAGGMASPETEQVPTEGANESYAETTRGENVAGPAEETASAVASPPAPREGDRTEAEGRAEDPALLPDDQAASFRTRWDPVQAAFVDEPASAVRDADGLVAEVMQAVARSFADERARLEVHWKQGEDVSTEDLRQTLQRYRSFFNRLLSA